MGDSVLAVLWATSCIAIVVMGVRLVGRYVTVRNFSAGDILTVGALACLCTRLGMIHAVLEYGSTNMADEYRETHTFTAVEIARRTTGSKLTVANRFIYNT